MAYKGYFHCRLCESTYFNVVTGSEKTVMNCMLQITDSIIKPDPPEVMCPSLIDFHFCEDGSRGIADFIGFRKEE